ncbi:Sodium-dependent multivitamin transporter [Liparis tanakae]|uniref:Sodium-dependent multivitamin transporter n=1 Tax=Liparis tanakae TaxID=230148 RepID=A0A4Z2EIB9_9TELE|nr:Sodium-dependent multivitamin transporter [Liparis tanakae]
MPLPGNTTSALHAALANVTLSRPSGLNRLYSLSYMWYSAFGCAAVVLTGLAVLMAVVKKGPMREEDVTPGTIYPLMGKLICLLPEPLKKKLCCVTPLGQTLPAQHKEGNGLAAPGEDGAAPGEDGAAPGETDRFLPEPQTSLVEHETTV